MNTTISPECSVCATPSKKYTTCPYCNYASCRTCAQTYILGETSPKCMSCRREWTREVQINELGVTFVNGPLKKHMENVLFDSQKALMPETLEIYEREYKVNLARRKSADAYRNLDKYKRDTGYYPAIKRHNELKDILSGIRIYSSTTDEATKLAYKKEYEELHKNILKRHSDPNYISLNKDNQEKMQSFIQIQKQQREKQHEKPVRTEPRFIRACPADNCRGFLSSKWKCGLCDRWTCPDCLVVKGTSRDGDMSDSSSSNASTSTRSSISTHICNPDNVASAKLLAKDTKPCPKCSANIFKIDGCDQMWCTICHTAFSWTTGNIETRGIHNPHYFAFKRAQNTLDRAMGDVPCGRNLDNDAIESMRGLIVVKNMDEPLMLRIHDYIRAANHLQYVELPKYRTDRVVNNRDLRLKYIASEISEDTFRSRLVRDMKKHDKNCEIGNVLQMLHVTICELLHRYMQEISPLPTVEIGNCIHTLDEIDLLYEYVNDCLLNISRVYGTTQIGVRVMDPASLDEPIHDGTGIYSIPSRKRPVKQSI
jgi:hypothetical protein